MWNSGRKLSLSAPMNLGCNCAPRPTRTRMSLLSCAAAALHAGRIAARPIRMCLIRRLTAIDPFGCTAVSAPDSSPAEQLLDDQIRRFLGTHLRRVDAHLGMLGRLIRAVDAGEILELAGPRLGVEALRVALLGLGERRIDEDLEKLALGEHPPHHVPLGSERRDEGGHDD